MKASEWIDRVKKERGWDSDYRVAKELGLSRQAISDYRVGKSLMDDGAALRVASALGEPPEIILIDQAAERAKSPEARTVLRDALRRLGGVAAGVIVAVGVGGSPSPAQAGPAVAASSGLYIMSNGRRKRRGVLATMADTLRTFASPASLSFA